MSFEISEAFVGQFRSNLMMLVAQDDGSRLRRAVSEEDVRGTVAYVEQLGSTTLQLATTRHADTPLVSIPHSRRRLALETYRTADLIDNPDRVRTLIDPTNPYAMRMAQAAGRTIDDVIIAAMFSETTVSGGGAAGEATTTVVWSTAGNEVAEGFNTTTDSSLTKDKILEAGRILDENEVPKEDRYLAVNADMIAGLLTDDDNISSADYNTVRLLMDGTINSFLGFEWIRTERLLATADPYDRAMAFHRDALRLGVGSNPRVRISERDDKNYSTQVFVEMDIGAVRLEEARVVEIVCDPAGAGVSD